MKILLIIASVLLLLVLELYLLMLGSELLGANETLLLVVLGALAGMIVLRTQGLSNVSKMKETIEAGGLPTGALFESPFILLAGLFLLLPGFISDIVGVILFIPVLRRYLLYRLLKKVFAL